MEISRVEVAGTALSAEGTHALVAVPSLEVSRSEQRYEPIGPDAVRFRSGDFEAVLELDADGFVRRYPGLAERRE
jgi:uncharacterized protein